MAVIEKKSNSLFILGKTSNRVKIEQSGEYVHGFAGGKRFNITNCPEQICAFILSHIDDHILIVSLSDIRLLEMVDKTVQFCADQDYLEKKLVPIIINGEKESLPFTPHSHIDEPYTLSNVRLSTPAGYFIGTLLFEEGYPEVYSRDTGYYGKQDDLLKDYPNSLARADAMAEANHRGWIKE